MESRGISLDTTALSKLKALETSTVKPMLGLQSSEYKRLISTVTHIVHDAWLMTIKRALKGFEAQFQAMRNLFELARDISCRRPKGYKVDFQSISFIANVGLYPLWSGQSRVPEERMTVDSVLPSGYGDGKLVCERMLDKTLHRFPITSGPW